MSGCEKQMCCYPSCACDVPLAKRPTATFEREEVVRELGRLLASWGNNQIYMDARHTVFKAKRLLETRSATLLKGAGGEHFTLDAEGWPQRIEPAAYIEHHKGGDNLTWEPVDHPYAKATPLYKAPVSATAPRANPIPLIKRLREQRDDVADMLREIVEDDFLAAYPAVEARAGALLKTIPTAEQQLRNIAEGIGMPYDDLIAALNDRADSRNKNG